MAGTLREAANAVEVVGTVKKVDLETKVSAKSGKEMIIGSILMEVKENAERIHNIKVKIFSMKLNKQGAISGLYKGYETVKNEWKPGDRAKITGSITLQEYYSRSGAIVSFNEVKGLFCNRLEEGDQTPDKAIATVEMVVKGMTPEIDADQIPTGNLVVDAFTVGYNSTIIPLTDLIITGDLGQQFQGMYGPNTTGKITMKINNYATVAKEAAPAVTHGFGSTEAVEDTIVKDYTSNLEIIGGDLPYHDGVNEYTPENIAQADTNRQLALQQLQQNASAPATPTANGFGTAGATPVNDPMANAFGGTPQPNQINNADPFATNDASPFDANPFGGTPAF